MQKEFEETFQTETKNLKDELINTLDKESSSIDIYLVKWYDNLNKFYSPNLERKNLLYKKISLISSEEIII